MPSSGPEWKSQRNVSAPQRTATYQPDRGTLRAGDQAEDFYMTVHEQIKAYMATQPEPKRSDMQALHRLILALMPACKWWFLA
jgi:hypothetical protein